MMNTNKIRQLFLEYFKANDHQIVASSPLVPANDPTLLFTNAGMVQFKDVFLGNEQPAYSRAASSQCCVRAGGKHNDLENVGYTARHHTFFEMLGNFSFGDYFKREAIHYAWDFLTNTLKLPPEKLWVTVYEDDDEAADIWLKEVKVSKKRFARCGAKDNFWSMGDTGPCGPCTEIFYDHGPGIAGAPPGSADADGDRYVEIWNLVFMQYNRAADGSMTELPKPSVDTGMGLERIAAIMQGVHSNYDIELFVQLIHFIADLAGITDKQHTSLKVIADHIRSTAFLITDGITPSNEGRGYVLRRIIRRAVRHGHQLGLRDPFFYKIVTPLVAVMGEAYPELAKAQKRIEKILLREEQKFIETLDQGLKVLTQQLPKLTTKQIPGDLVFRLYDTYGFPPDLTADIAREKNLTIDYPGFEQAMNQQRQRSQAASQFAADYGKSLEVSGKTEFTGHERVSDQAKVMTLFRDQQSVNALQAGDQGIVVLDRTPFYAEAGGQVGDKGQIYFLNGCFQVSDTQKQQQVVLHIGTMQQGELTVDMQVNAEVDSSRQAIMLNHSATHLLHAALRRVLGEHVLQKGSLVEADRLRFDYAHFEPLTTEQIRAVEQLVNQQIRANLFSNVEVMSLKQAKKIGALALFGEKYSEQVRVLNMGEFSTELCGGTHVEYSGQIGLFKITSETGIAAGIRRIEALTGEHALSWVEHIETTLNDAAALLKTEPGMVLEKLKQQLRLGRESEKALAKLKQQLAKLQSGDIASQAVDVQGVKVLATEIAGADVKALREMVDQLKQQLQPAVVLLATVQDSKVQLIAGVSQDCTDRLQAGKLVNHVAKQIAGKGGGRADMAQGGGTDPAALPAALQSVTAWVEQQLQQR